MAEQIVSPGVFQRETDQSFITPAPVEVGAAIIGPTVKGPVERPTVVTSFADYKNKFGTTFVSASENLEFFTSIAAQKFFANGGNSMLVTRVSSGSFTSADSTNINNESVSGVNKASGSLTITSFAESTTIFVSSSTIGLTQFVGQTNPNTDASDDTIRFFDRGASLGDFIDNFVTEFNATSKFSGFEARNEGDTKIGITGSAAGTGGNGLGFSSGSGTNPGSLGASTEGGTDSAAGEVVFTLSTIGQGTVFNGSTGATDPGELFADGSLKSGSIDNLRWEISGVNTANGTFNLSIRRGDDNNNNKIILETFVGCSLDPKSDNFISKVVGDQTTTTTEAEGQTFIKVEGEFPNQSKFVRVKSVSKLTTDYLLADGSIGTDSAGSSYSLSLPSTGSGSFHGATGTNIPTGEPMLTFKNISGTDSQGLVADDYTTAINILKNQDEYRFSTITAPGMYNKDYGSVVASIIELCEGRGDCFYIADMVPYGAELTGVGSVTGEAGELNTNFAGTYWPWVQVPSTELSKNVYVPASTVMQGVYAANDRIAAPWFAPAGLNRGGLPVVRTEFKLNQAVRDKLYDNKVNPIATFPRVGPVAYGQKTLQKKASALDRINVRRLLISLKNFIGDTSKNLVFEQNTTVTRNKFLNAVNPFLESVQQRQGLYAFRVVMDESNNTAEAIDRNQLVGQIFIQPTKTAEFIILDYTIQPTGATFND